MFSSIVEIITAGYLRPLTSAHLRYTLRESIQGRTLYTIHLPLLELVLALLVGCGLIFGNKKPPLRRGHVQSIGHVGVVVMISRVVKERNPFTYYPCSSPLSAPCQVL